MYAKKLSIVCAVSFLFLLADNASACSCSGWPTPCQAYESASAVLVAYVTDVKLMEGPQVAKLQYPPGTAYLKVEQAFKGVSESDVRFPEGTGGDCIPVFKQGQRWLIYARRDPQLGSLNRWAVTEMPL